MNTTDTGPLDDAEYATGETALSRRTENKGPDADPLITTALTELRAEFPQYVWTASIGRNARSSCIHANEFGDSEMYVQYMGDHWAAGGEMTGRHECTRMSPVGAFRAFVESAQPRKNFTQKPRIDLIPPGVLSRHVLPVLHDGAQKHGRDHWRGCTRREYALAAATHVLAYLDGEETDESGHAALAHAAADLLLGLGVG